MHINDFLPEPLDATPWPLFSAWFQMARAQQIQPNPDAMVLATVGPDARPSARVVLCKRLVPDPGFLVFFTNYESRKGRELTAYPRAAAVMHWDHLHRQVRVEGPVIGSPAAESDEYFASRALDSRIGAWASKQSAPLSSRQVLVDEVASVAQRFGIAPDAKEGVIPRPPNWGGFRLWPESVELWVEGPNRVHDRAVWTRSLERSSEFEFRAGPWTVTRLNP
jgi:pyridoxamine 5'-phosphate oxidase